MSGIITIKIGSNVLTNQAGTLDEVRIAHLVEQIAQLRQLGKKIILVSSGAVASGRSLINLERKLDMVSERQLLSSVGQVKLVNLYSEMFEKHDLPIAQVLVTKEDFRTREHYLNMKNCISSLLDNDIIPVVNENDAVSVTALMFTDNDELSGLIATMIGSDELYVLSNVDGIYNGDPKDETTQVIKSIDSNKADLSKYISTAKSDFGRGGMLTKCRIAQKTAEAGISVRIANGTKEQVLTMLANKPDELVHTHFVAGSKKGAMKKWIAYSEGFASAEIIINNGAETALRSTKATSLLLPGVLQFSGEFKKGDLVRIKNEQNKVIGIGRAQYDIQRAKMHLGDKKYKPLIHYDYLYLLPIT